MKIMYGVIPEYINHHSTVIVDMDGTLTDDRHRHFLALAARNVDGQHTRDAAWKEYHEQCHADTPNQLIADLCQMFYEAGKEIWVVTARPEYVYKQTMAWISKHLRCHVSLVAMRPADNRESAHILKRDFLASVLQNQYHDKCGNGKEFYAIIDDSKRVIKALSPFGDTMLYRMDANPAISINPSLQDYE